MSIDSTWWLSASRRDLAMAQELYDKKFYEGTAFHCQQCAEKALKALLAHFGRFNRTHSCDRLLDVLEEFNLPINKIRTAAKKLDIHYIPSRYPNGVGGAPERFYDRIIATELLELAKTILKWAEAKL
ncbi:MAG: HEPN domain-containing protein [Candidatus Heimdallarchaeota archaeon]